MSKKNKSENWELKSLRLGLREYGEDAGKYTGSIEFENGDEESFKFKIRPEMADSYIKLIAGDIVKSADSLAERLVASLQLRDRPES